MSYIEIKNLCKTYDSNSIKVEALQNISLEIEKGELVCIFGPSGSGKTTLLNLIGGIDTSTSGSIIIDGNDITKLKNKSLIKYRRTDIGYIFQFYNLIQNLTALENIELAVQLTKKHLDPMETLRSVGLMDKANSFPSQLSGGEQQRVSVARAIAKNPKILLCDEPTGALDYITGKQILKLLKWASDNLNMTVIIVTHNAALAPMADKIVKFRNKVIEEVVINKEPKPVDEIVW